MTPGDVFYTYFMAVMIDVNGEHWLDQTLVYNEPTGAFMTPVVSTRQGLVAVMQQHEQDMLICAPRNQNAVQIRHIVSTMPELDAFAGLPYMSDDEPTTTEQAFNKMMARLIADNPTLPKE